MTKKEIGNLGEKLAEKFLIKKNYLILAKNYTIKGGEIDIIAQNLTNTQIIFVEVKTRTSNSFGYPENAVNSAKKEHLQKTAQKYLIDYNYPVMQDYRFDTLAVELNMQTRQAKIIHFECV